MAEGFKRGPSGSRQLPADDTTVGRNLPAALQRPARGRPGLRSQPGSTSGGAVGRDAGEVVDPAELDLLRRGPLKSWATASTEHWIRIAIEEISGRRISEN